MKAGAHDLAVTVHLRLKRAAARAGPSEQAILAGVAAALAAVAGQGLVDYTLRNSVILTTVFTLLGCAFALTRADEHTRPTALHS